MSASINDRQRRQHATSFGAAAREYRRGRPPYPREAVDWLLPTGAATVVDLGAGTGKFTELLVAPGREVIAVEPSAGMREQLADAVPAATVHGGTAERIPLPDASADAVLMAQAWHWVDPELAVPEIARVLRPGGTLGLVWNIRDSREPWVAELDDLLHHHSRQDLDTAPELPAPFAAAERAEFSWRHTLTRDAVLDMIASRSYVIVLPEPERAELLGNVTELLASHPDLADHDDIVLPYVTRCTRATR
ncbi:MULTISPECIES: class I SAM-dependent methyltransferase [unclassified Actinoplanes]|uniref:class I SAM-dependent methyltransferase n=1 Tax=unclassified Actinoplanes TaxID=2626549 RepID=UPI0009C2148F|nr:MULTISPECIES: class I SAM-dependent methyltransferase [unclassified Actinoplanes]SLL99762.1 SAM-dependent methyltransferase [Actinoplanes sp. SE50/110]